MRGCDEGKADSRQGKEIREIADTSFRSGVRAAGPLLRVQSASSFATSSRSSSPGAALLADESEEGLRRIFDAARTSQTDFDYLVKSVVTIRRNGWCVRRRIAGWPIDGYSAPVRNRAGAVFAAVTLLQPSGRFADRTVVKLLKDVAMAS